MAKARPLLLYSTNTSLAYNLNQHYYGGQHWIWCNLFFDEAAARAAGHAAPPSSMPIEIYRSLSHAIARADFHNDMIKQNRIGLLRGAKAQLAARKISQSQFDDVRAIIRKAQLADFCPLIYIIPFAGVAAKVMRVSPISAANPFSAEFQIASLDRGKFDIISP